MRHYRKSLLIAATLATAACSSDDSTKNTPADGSVNGDSTTGSGDGGGACFWRSTADGGGAVRSETVATPFPKPSDAIAFADPTIPCTIFKITDYGAVSTPDALDGGTGSEAGTGSEGGSGGDASGADAGIDMDAPSGEAGISNDAAFDGDAAIGDAGPVSEATTGDAAPAIDGSPSPDGEAGSLTEGGTVSEAGAATADAGGPTASGPVPTNTKAFKDAIAAAKAAGGGVVDVPPGTWVTGPIHLESNIELHLEAGATVVFSQNVQDYEPPVLTRWEGLDVMNWSPFVYALNATNVAITGPGPGAAAPGVLDGQGSTWWSWKTPSKAEDQRIYTWWLTHLTGLSGPPTAAQVPTSAVVNGLRPTMIECNGCTNFLIDGITTANPAYWVIHPLYSTNVIVRNSHITSNSKGSNGDGIDVDSCKNILIENDSFSTSDDIISVKSGLNENGIAVARPTEELVVRNITAEMGHAISFGSEMSGGINNVLVDTATLNNMQYLLRMKTLPGRGGVISNVWFQNVTGANWTIAALEISTNYQSSTIAPSDPTNPAKFPEVKNITIKNVTGTSMPPYAVYNFVGLPAKPFSNIVLDTVNLSGKAGTCQQATGISLANSTLTGLAAGTTSVSCLATIVDGGSPD